MQTLTNILLTSPSGLSVNATLMTRSISLCNIKLNAERFIHCFSKHGKTLRYPLFLPWSNGTHLLLSLYSILHDPSHFDFDDFLNNKQQQLHLYWNPHVKKILCDIGYILRAIEKQLSLCDASLDNKWMGHHVYLFTSCDGHYRVYNSINGMV